MVIVGRGCCADHALKDGILTQIVEKPVDIALEKAKILSGLSPMAIKETKRLMTFNNEILKHTFDDEMKVFSQCLESVEALQAFEKFLKK